MRFWEFSFGFTAARKGSDGKPTVVPGGPEKDRARACRADVSGSGLLEGTPTSTDSGPFSIPTRSVTHCNSGLYDHDPTPISVLRMCEGVHLRADCLSGQSLPWGGESTDRLGVSENRGP